MQEEKWSNVYRYTVANGIRIVNINLNKYLPSYLTIAGHGVWSVMTGSPRRVTAAETWDTSTRYALNAKQGERVETPTPQTWTDIIVNGKRPQKQTHTYMREDKNPPCQSESPHYDTTLHCRDQDQKWRPYSPHTCCRGSNLKSTGPQSPWLMRVRTQCKRRVSTPQANICNRRGRSRKGMTIKLVLNDLRK